MAPCGYQSHPAQNQRDSTGKLGTTDDCDREGFEFKSASHAFVISAADQANGVTAE
jgi:hypothetical protein